MFDWNDEELTNIIWGEANESGDHIVPYPEANEDYRKKKEWSQENGNIKSTEQKAPGTKVDIHGRKFKSSSNFDGEGASASGFAMDPWPNLSLSSAVKIDQDSLDTAPLGEDAVIFRNPQEGKEQGDLVDYGWANVGSFDDLDRMFSNDDPIFGNVSLGSADELWPSSKDLTNGPAKSFPISVSSTTDYAREDDQLFTLGYGKVDDPASHVLQSASSALNHVEFAGGKTRPMAKEEQTDMTIMGKNTTANSLLTAEDVAMPNQLEDKNYKQKKLLKGRKKLEEKRELKLYQDFYGSWSSSGNQAGQFKNQFVGPVARISLNSILSQQRQLQGHGRLQYQQISNPFMAASAYGSTRNPYSAMPLLSHMQSGEFKDEQLLSGYEVSSCNANPVNKLTDSPAKGRTMTPQEKIEKLRRRQQIQAMLAIEKQQQQFGHQVSPSDQSITQKCSQDNPILHVEKSDLEVEDLSTLPSFDPNSPIEQDDSRTISLPVNDYFVEDTVLYQLEDIISKLDVRIRLRIRDSLFRLAQSAMQRNYASNTSSTNNSRDEEVVAEEETSSHNRNAKMPEVETETNPIDRAVAHLLFHRPLELAGKHPDAPESLASSKLPREHKTATIANLTLGCSAETLKNKQAFSPRGPKSSCPLVDPQSVGQCESNLCLGILENASNKAPPDPRIWEVKASK